MTIGGVAIGRNEGERLKRCLTTLGPYVDRLVYVDSGSTDGSVEFARSIGAEVVELDTATPFTAARARNAGFAALEAAGPVEFVQFVDGDCGVEAGWVAAAKQALAGDATLAIVTGWRTEIDPRANAFHAMAEIEWHRPAGEIEACGGDMMVRAEAIRQIGGFDAAIIASEDEDFVIRVRKAGWRALRLPLAMTRHDIAMTKLSEWWRRNLRTGNGLAEVGDLHPPHFRAERLRAWLFGCILPLLFVLSAIAGLWWVSLGVLAAFAFSTYRVRRWLQANGMAAGLALRVASLFTLAKLPHFIGMLRFWLRGGRKGRAQIIEYK